MLKSSAKASKVLSIVLSLVFILSLSVTSARAASYMPIRSEGSGMVLSSHKLADEIGQKVLDSGGNAVDAAVAVGYALSVVYPAAGNLGGGGFAIVHINGETTAADFREKAPAAATRDMYLDKDGNVIPDLSLVGYKAAGVPGSVAGLNALLAKYGTKPLSEIIAPSIINLAEKGFLIDVGEVIRQSDKKEIFEKFASTKKYFLKPDGSLYKEGDLFVQKDLAETLKRISKEGDAGFYKGKTAQLIADDMAKNGGLITLKDLEDYKIAWRQPVKGSYRGYEIISMSPPSSGGTHLVQILNVMENADIEALGFASSATIHIMAEAMRYAYADRSEYMGDPDFVKVPVESLISKEYAKSIYEKIAANKDKATSSSEVKPGLSSGKEGTNTTHYSVVDKKGNAVSVTYTINDWYGSGAAVMGAGFFLNNEMDDFAAKTGVPNLYGLVGSDANSIAPGKRPLSSMSPSLVLKDGKLLMVVGSPGGSRIITTTLQVISNVIDHKMDISEAVQAPRIHFQWLPDQLRTEKYGLVKDVENKLKEMGYDITVQEPMGDVNAILVDHETGMIYGSHDPRTTALD